MLGDLEGDRDADGLTLGDNDGLILGEVVGSSDGLSEELVLGLILGDALWPNTFQ